jgi:predicted nucleic acid-binding protein
MPFVLDNSVVTAWFIESQATDYADAVAHRMRSDRAHVPALWELEFTNVLRTACVRGRLEAARAQAVAARIAQLPLEVDRQGAPPRELLGLALRFGLTAYDAAYLELALRLSLPIATQDEPLRDAALASGVGWVDAVSAPQ